MKRFYPSILIFPIFLLAFNKSGILQLEITPYFRLDKYSEFKEAYRNRASIDHIKLNGTSFGLNFGYKFLIADDIYITPSVGYFKQEFSSIKTNNTMFGKSETRPILFPSPLFILFYTDKYSYQSVNISIGVERVFRIGRNKNIYTGLNINNYVSFAERYHLINNPGGSLDYARNDIKYSASTIALICGLNKKWGKNALGPVLIVPVFNFAKKDLIFGESTGVRGAWMIGIGMGISYTHQLF